MKSKKAASKKPLAGEAVVKSPDYLDIAFRFLTRELCSQVFEETRDKERQRKWTLHALVWFWIGLLQGKFASQTRAVLEARTGNPLLPKVDASPESFFMKIQAVRPAFFRGIFRGFTDKASGEMKPSFALELEVPLADFPDIFAVDGSRLAKVGRLLKATRAATKAILPGSMEAVYDVRRGHLRDLWFDPDGCASELSMFEKTLESIPSGALLLADRYYAKPVVWAELERRGISMVSRHNKTVGKKKLEELSRTRGKLNVDDWLVCMGGSGSEHVVLRWVHLWGDGFDLKIVTNVLSPKKLSPLQLMALYRKRWSVERMYLAMKDVLELNDLYNCSPAAAGQQVYATAILYNSLRLAQSQLAEKGKVRPEELSEKKLFPKLIDNFIKATFMLAGAETVRAELPPRVRSTLGDDMPGITIDHPSFAIRIKDYLVEKRSDKRRQRRYCKGRAGFTAFGKIPGTKSYLAN